MSLKEVMAVFPLNTIFFRHPVHNLQVRAVHQPAGPGGGLLAGHRGLGGQEEGGHGVIQGG